MAGTDLERSILIPATPKRVWEAVSNPAQMLGWLAPALGMAGATASKTADGLVNVHLGNAVELLKFEGVKPPAELSLRSMPDGQITATMLFEEREGGTQLTVRLGGFEALPEDARADRMDLTASGWEKTLGNLKAYIAGEDLPEPFASAAVLFGYVRQARKTLAGERSIWIKASRERVWQALVDPAQLQGWFSPTTPWNLSALEVGGKFFVINEETKKETYGNVIEVLEPPTKLVMRSVPDDGSNLVKHTTYSLRDESDGTRLMVNYVGYELDPEATRWENLERDTYGFGMMLQNTKAFIEGKVLPFPGGF
jgi:uncharacterized protein YndB with AHSA1/START domain